VILPRSLSRPLFTTPDITALTAATVVAGVDAARLKNVAQLYRATGLASDEASALAFLFLLLHLGPEPALPRQWSGELLQPDHPAAPLRAVLADSKTPKSLS
jgi:hypothetical protein